MVVSIPCMWWSLRLGGVFWGAVGWEISESRKVDCFCHRTGDEGHDLSWTASDDAG